ncbi:hypothetical protein CK501_05720 [Halovibrio salipaludis]|uniref:Uncharacterized protein n=1 Tax=Halovibrio salipaludis TaxID=2032626 RepID=A0A2A2F8A9_9GAMM|nr:hypothetical protein CK501_05720 [Halovibrio salipaludis]
MSKVTNLQSRTYRHQQDLANALARELIDQGGSAIGQAQVTALVAGKLAARAGLDSETYMVFVRELCEAVANEAGVSAESAYNHSSH